jgi:surfeit locus 1 family protein
VTRQEAKCRPRAGAARLISGAVATVAGCAFLVFLGAWQLHRLAWKEGLIARIEERVKASPSPLPSPSQWAGLRPDDYEYRHVALDGVFENDKEALVFRPSGGAARTPGFLVLTPLKLSSGAYVIVNRGFVPLDRKDPASRPESQIKEATHIEGLMRQPESRNAFTPADHPETGQYFTRDPGLIAAHFGLFPTAPFSIDADRAPGPGFAPQGGASEITFPNNHLVYALTWFGLALGWIGAFAAFAWQNR